MAKKNRNGNGGEQKESDAGKKEGGGGGDGNVSVVLKADLHCEGCVSKIVKSIRSCDGVVEVKVDAAANKVTVTGKVDPAALREKVEAKTHKQVVLVSPQPSKKGGDKEKDGGDKAKDGGGDGGAKQKENNKKEGDSKEANKGEKDKKKEPPVTTAVLKMNLHCEGCIQKIYKIVSKTKGYHEMKLDKQKELVTVTGAMDMKALAENLKKHLKRDVEIVPPKKDGGEKKEKGGVGNEKGKGGKKEGGGGGGGGGDKNGDGVNKMEVQVGYPYQGPYPYLYGSPGYVPDQMFYNYPHAPQLFSDENPNACSVM